MPIVVCNATTALDVGEYSFDMMPKYVHKCQSQEDKLYIWHNKFLAEILGLQASP